MKLKSITGSLLAVGALLAANPASADLTFLGLWSSIGGGDFQYDADAERGDLTCTGCEGLLSTFADGSIDNQPLTNPDSGDANGWSGSEADLFIIQPSSTATEEDFVEAITGLELTGTGIQSDPGDNTQFCTSSTYVLFKIGADPNYALVRNLSGGEHCYTYDPTGDGAGLSHIVTFGETVTVSEPSILALFGAGLLLLGFLRRRTIV